MSVRSRVIIFILLLLLAVMFISPTLQWYILIPEDSKKNALSSIPQIRRYAEIKAVEEQKKIQEFSKHSDESSPVRQLVVKMLRTVYKDISERDFKTAVEKYYRDETLYLKDFRNQTLQLGLDLQGGMYVAIKADFKAFEKEYGSEVPDWLQEEKVQQAMEILNSRIDQFGVTEPQIRRQGNRITVELPGAADPERIRKVIMGKGRLNFHLLDKEGVEAFETYKAEHPNDFLAPTGPAEPLKLNDPNILKPEQMLIGIYDKDEYGLDKRVGFTVIQREPVLRGEAIQNAYPDIDRQTGKPIVVFVLGEYVDEEGKKIDGAEEFYKVTDQHQGKALAVVLDDKIKSRSIANISEAISGGVVSIRGEFTKAEVNDLAKVLRTGPLPVVLNIENQSEVGPSLGEDMIREGLNAIMIGFLLILAFMILYYKGAGIIANMALFFNLFMLVSILSATGFTLTLTSIAGIILTVGMSVDANVIIFERIKEEYRLGKSRQAAIKTGFSKAFWTILDANVTTFIAAFILSLLSKGSVQGFAFTLAVGIFTSFISAIFISRLMFDFVTNVFKASRLSISWRRIS
ncbi:MAG: protein translocase subunit SecD [Spirochaetales bacterium]|nr:protein translocase subunit SecD [Spirochaetales bacterium]